MMSWQEDLIEEAEKVIKHGWGEVIFKVINNGKQWRTRTTYDNGYKDIKDDRTNPDKHTRDL